MDHLVGEERPEQRRLLDRDPLTIGSVPGHETGIGEEIHALDGGPEYLGRLAVGQDDPPGPVYENQPVWDGIDRRLEAMALVLALIQNTSSTPAGLCQPPTERHHHRPQHQVYPDKQPTDAGQIQVATPRLDHDGAGGAGDEEAHQSRSWAEEPNRNNNSEQHRDEQRVSGRLDEPERQGDPSHRNE